MFLVSASPDISGKSFSPNWIMMACGRPSTRTPLQIVDSSDVHLIPRRPIHLICTPLPKPRSRPHLENATYSPAQCTMLWPTTHTLFHDTAARHSASTKAKHTNYQKLSITMPPAKWTSPHLFGYCSSCPPGCTYDLYAADRHLPIAFILSSPRSSPAVHVAAPIWKECLLKPWDGMPALARHTLKTLLN